MRRRTTSCPTASTFRATRRDKPARISTRREWRDRLKLRPLNLKALKQGETALMAELFNDGWSGNWGFVPFTKEEFDSDADALQYLMPADFGIVVELDGVPQSFAIALPNLNEITRRSRRPPVPLRLGARCSRDSARISSNRRGCCCSARARRCKTARPAARSSCR